MDDGYDRTRLISLAGAAVVVVLIATALAVWLTTGPSAAPGTNHTDPYGLGTAAQHRPSASPSPARIVSAAASPSASRASATYKTIALLGLGGFDTEVTVTNPAGERWTVVLTMPQDKPIENLSPDAVTLTQAGTKVTVTPITLGVNPVAFKVRFPALLALGQSASSCTIDGQPCGSG